MKLKKKTKTVVLQQNPLGQIGAFTLHNSREAAEKYVKDFVEKNVGGGVPIGLTEPMWLILPASLVYVGEFRAPPEQPLVQPVPASALPPKSTIIAP